MAKKRKRSGGGGRKKRARGQKAVLHLSSLVVILWLLERLGVLNQSFWAKVQSGDVGGAVQMMQTAIQMNFMGSGMPITVGSGISVALVTYLVRAVSKGSTISLKKPKAIAV